MIASETQPGRTDQAQSGATETQSPGAAHVRLNSQELLRGQKAIVIAHNGALYRLQTTRQGKLILTK